MKKKRQSWKETTYRDGQAFYFWFLNGPVNWERSSASLAKTVQHGISLPLGGIAHLWVLFLVVDTIELEQVDELPHFLQLF